MIEFKNVSYSYEIKNRVVPILEDCSFEFKENSFSAIMSPSGAGKTTLLNIIGMLINEYMGDYYFEGSLINKRSDKQMSKIRSRDIGFVFQNFKLIQSLTIIENIKLALEITKSFDRSNLTKMSQEILERVGLIERAEHYPYELSGGEAQRVALARAVVKQPKILLADEPTGNLDTENSSIVMQMLKDFHKGGGTIIMVTHSNDIARYAQFLLGLTNKRIVPV